MRVLTPTMPTDTDAGTPVIFLAGPIRGAERWQERAIAELESLGVSAVVANPRRDVDIDRDFSDADYDAQVDWEQAVLDRAAKGGVIMFWLATEKAHDCAHPYAMQTRFELGEAIATHRALGAKVVVGIEGGFGGDRYVRRIIDQKAPGISVASTLVEACAAAARVLVA